MQRLAELSRALMLGGVIAYAACASSGQMAVAGARPRLRSITPDTVSMIRGNVVTVDLHGAGFDTARTAPRNTVHIGSLVLRDVASGAQGTLIRLVVPDMMASAGEAPPTPWRSGRYPVSVTTSSGSSDTVMLTILSRGSEP